MPDGIEDYIYVDRSVKFIGEKGNCWDGEVVSPGEKSAEVDLKDLPHISIILKADSDVTVNFQVSPDNQNWVFCGQISQQLPQGGDNVAHVYETVGARYARLIRDSGDTADVEITATIQAKP